MANIGKGVYSYVDYETMGLSVYQRSIILFIEKSSVSNMSDEFMRLVKIEHHITDPRSPCSAAEL